MIWQFASRYFRAKKSTNAINIIAWVSVSAIAVGAGALIIILSVFNGFEGLVKSLYSTFYPSVKVSAVSGKSIVLTPAQLKQIAGVKGVAFMTEVVEEKAVLRYGQGDQTIAILKGVDSNYNKVAAVDKSMSRGKFDTGEESQGYNAILGLELEMALGVDVQRDLTPISVYLPRRNVSSVTTPEDALSSGILYPAGSFNIQQEFNSKYVLTNIAFMRGLLGMGEDEMSALEVKGTPGLDDKVLKRRLGQVLGPQYTIQTRYEQNQALYAIMQTERWAVYVIMSFILVIAAFNMIGSLYMLVMEKQKDITILKAMGARPQLITRIFLAEGMIIAGLGTLIGFGISITFCLLQQHFGLIRLEEESFLVNAYPVSMQFSDFVLVCVTIVVIGGAASWYPARRAGREQIALKAT
ncbi:FtsX-like permease family protein [Chitinophaga rhizophila]|uniref:FtsX-like permease family protein n=1 Tax=Chitinophaga rhizophila TaxID=2866212 RepID=A0ABS7GEC6_9BACT|nr:FtsX-like permease family protein [Chitinophaga rhizophila]MBW8685761.1 FtsX-like permease family protein [Chitinophaga rhizophila]